MSTRISVLMLLAACIFALSGCVEPAESPDEPAATEVDQMPDDAGADTESPAESEDEAPSGAESEGPGTQAAGLILARVQDRGTLICGVNDQLPGFGFITEDGEHQGFDVDFCRAFAAAIFGDPDAVEYRPLTAQERFTALQTGEIDVLSRNTTWTLTRDTDNGLDFMPTTFYDGQGVMVPVALGIEGLEGLDGASICVQSGTTTEKNIADAMRRLSVDYTPVVFDEPDQTYGAYETGRCDAVTSDKSQLLSRKSVLENPADHEILEATLSKEPLGPAVLQGDPAWADLMTWVVFGIFTAEELEINSENIEDFMNSDDPEVRRFLGVEENMGENLGVGNDFMVDVIGAVGNYGEIYDRNLGPDTAFDLPPGQNQLWSEGGLLYAPPFR